MYSECKIVSAAMQHAVTCSEISYSHCQKSTDWNHTMNYFYDMEQWDETKARHEPAHMKLRRSRNMKYMYINGRHFTKDCNAWSKWDFHYYAVKRYVHEEVAMRGDSDDPTTLCDFCDDMSEGARRARWRLYIKLRLQKTKKDSKMKKP